MKRRPLLALAVLAGALGGSPASAQEATPKPGPEATPPRPKAAPLFEGLGKHGYPVTTSSEAAQRYFDQGLMLAYGFNHAEASRSFREAARLDPDCAMCFWGAALVLGPNVNAPMEPQQAPEAHALARKALELASRATAQEQALIEALAQRYAPQEPEDRRPLDQAYANAMRLAATRFPEDLEIATQFAESLLDLHPWDTWARDGKPRPWTPEILETLERVLAKNPDHPGAIHHYIHALETSPEPQRAEPYADRLGRIAPGVGHLVHVASHIYLRVGRYHDASLANEAAASADAAYLLAAGAVRGLYPLAHVPHKHHFLAYSAGMEGWSAKANQAARAVAAKVDPRQMARPGFGGLQHWALTPLYVYVRFGWWQEILQHPAPAGELPYPTGIWHYARGRALTAGGRLDEAERELAALRTLAGNEPALAQVTIWGINPASRLLQIAAAVLAGELAAKRGQFDTAIQHLRQAVELEDGLNYDEPPDWSTPVRHSLGAVLLEAGRPEQAEEVYLEDLKRNPENGWSLFGLAKSLQAQGKEEEAAEVQVRLDKAWASADVALAASRF
jgi:tetratricopeptide (TPR) repeat protein